VCSSRALNVRAGRRIRAGPQGRYISLDIARM
jgi:hypothetical protein